MYGRDDVVRSILNYHNSPLFPEHSVVSAVLPDRYVAGGLALPLVLAAMFGRLEVLKTLVEYTRARASAVLANDDAVIGGAGGGGGMTSRTSRSSFSSQPNLANHTSGISAGSISISTKSMGGGGSGGYPPRSASPSLVAGEESKLVDVFDQVDHTSYTLLHHAAVHGHLNVAQYLLGRVPVQHGDKDQEKDQGLVNNSTALSTTITGGKKAKNLTTLHGRTPLILAVDHMRPKSHIQADKSLAMEKADKGRLKVFKELVKVGANLEARDGSGRTPLIVAAGHGLIHVMELLYGKRKDKEEEARFLACLYDTHNDTHNPNQQTGAIRNT